MTLFYRIKLFWFFFSFTKTLRAASYNASIWMEVSPLMAPCGPPFSKTDIIYACIFFFFFFTQRCRLCSDSVVSNTTMWSRRCDGGGRQGHHMAKNSIVERSVRGAACLLLPPCRTVEAAVLPSPHSSSNCPLFMNKICFGLTYFFSQCLPVLLTQNVSSDPLKWTPGKTIIYRLAFV